MAQAPWPGDGGTILTLLLTYCVIWGKFHKLAILQFLHLPKGKFLSGSLSHMGSGSHMVMGRGLRSPQGRTLRKGFGPLPSPHQARGRDKSSHTVNQVTNPRPLNPAVPGVLFLGWMSSVPWQGEGLSGEGQAGPAPWASMALSG